MNDISPPPPAMEKEKISNEIRIVINVKAVILVVALFSVFPKKKN